MKSVVLALVAGMAWLAGPVAAETNAANPAGLPAQSMLTKGGGIAKPERKASPFFTGTNLPVPPMQNAPWTPPPNTGLPTNYLSATETLFAQGLADPRGCDYREIEVGISDSFFNQEGVITAHGWVLPGDSTPSFAVAWNGLVYPVIRVGDKADLEADVAWLESHERTDYSPGMFEEYSLRTNSYLGFKGCLLLRLGQTDLARRLWLQKAIWDLQDEIRWESKMKPGPWPTNMIITTNDVTLPKNDPYNQWAGNWAEIMYERALYSFERNDLKMALITARQLAAVKPLIAAACAQHDPCPEYRMGRPYLPMGHLTNLLADLERREAEGPRSSILDGGMAGFTNQNERIAALIRDLDQIHTRAKRQPGWASPYEDPIATALIAEGEAAIEPLMNCLENDQRLTRYVGFDNYYRRGDEANSVKDIAWYAVESILHARFKSRAELHAYWDKYKSLKLEDRWYETLKDDAASNRWLEVASRIVAPVKVTPEVEEDNGAISCTNGAMRGEVLRVKTNPSVTELLARRALEISTTLPEAEAFGSSYQMTEYLARWDATVAGALAQTLSERLIKLPLFQPADPKAPKQKAKADYEWPLELLAKLSLIRARAGDPQAFSDYAARLLAVTPEQLDHPLERYLEPLIEFPTNTAIQSASLKLFADTNSSWAGLLTNSLFRFNPLGLKLIHNPGFRVLLVHELDKTNSIGACKWHVFPVGLSGKTNLYGSFRWEGYGYSSGDLIEPWRAKTGDSIKLPDGMRLTNEATCNIRICDGVALSLANDPSFPFFNPFAPEAKRNRIIADIKRQLSETYSK